ETTVTVHGKGQGGRNQEVALGALAALPKNGLVVSFASDGIDNSPVAGALVDEQVRERVQALQLRPERALEKNDSLTFFEAVGSSIKTGVTGVNISDLMLGLQSR
ncbi:MAG TPA: MOFRL family protein, partial [Patescibacteria group bacterium]|nr:MOFRL family protein [Patescibacteria group bacterium]